MEVRKHTLVDVRGVGLLSGLGALLLVARWGGSLLAGLLLLNSRSLASWCLAAGGWGLRKRLECDCDAPTCQSRAKLPFVLPLVPFRLVDVVFESWWRWWMK